MGDDTRPLIRCAACGSRLLQPSRVWTLAVVAVQSSVAARSATAATWFAPTPRRSSCGCVVRRGCAPSSACSPHGSQTRDFLLGLTDRVRELVAPLVAAEVEISPSSSWVMALTEAFSSPNSMLVFGSMNSGLSTPA